jgi:cell fate regulator YaaT (PSP1 superfamily)
MAKLQKATLDPSKISGYCGRLKCCLRYEDHTYRDLSKRLPRRKARVKTSQGEGIVIDAQVLTQLISIRGDDGTIFAVPVEEVQVIQQPTGRPEPDDVEIDSEEMNDQKNPGNENGKQ